MKKPRLRGLSHPVRVRLAGIPVPSLPPAPQPTVPTSPAAPPHVPAPDVPALAAPYGILVTGIGGTGVVTIGSLLGMAPTSSSAGSAYSTWPAGAEKGGAVLSHVQLAPRADDLHATRIATGEARLIIGCDTIVTAMPDVLGKALKGRTRRWATAPVPTAEIIHNQNGASRAMRPARA